MPIKSKKQYKLIQSIRSKYKNKKEAPEDKKWAFDNDFDPSKVDYNSLPDEKKTSIEEFFNSLESISCSYFEEYRKDVENLNDTYINLISNMNYPFKNVNFFNEGVTFANELIFNKVIETLDKDIKDVNDFLNKLATELNNVEVWEKQKNILLKKISELYNIDMSGFEDENQDNKNVKKLLDSLEKDYEKFKKETQTDNLRIKFIKNELNNLDTQDLKTLLNKFITKTGQEENIKSNLDKLIDELNKGDRSNKNDLLDILKRKISGALENLQIDYTDEKTEEKEDDSIKPLEAFKILKEKFIFNAIYMAMKKRAKEIDAGIKIAEDRVGTSQAKFNPLGEKGNQIILAKKLILAYLVIVSSFMMANYVVEEDKREIEEGLNKDIENILNKYYYSEINVGALVTAPIKLFTIPARFAFKIGNRAVAKALTITTVEELTESPKSFIVNARRYFMMLGGNSNQMEKVLNQYGITFDILSKIEKKEISKEVVIRSSNKLINMFNRMAISKTATKLFQEYGIKQSFGARLGEIAGEKVKKISEWNKSRKEEMSDDETFSTNDDIDKNKVENTNV